MLSLSMLTGVAAADYSDLKPHWAEQAMEFAVQSNLMDGISEYTFAADAPATRACLVQALYRMESRVSGVRLKIDDLFAAPRVARELMQYIDADTLISDWTKSHANFFRAVQIEKNVMFIILLLIVAVAAFNIVSTLVMAVQDKQADIAILRTLGASPGSIMAIFVIQGALIGLIGLAIGVLGGVTLALNIDVVVPAIERAFGIQFLAKDVYYISDLPSELQWADVITISSVSFTLSAVSCDKTN